MSIPAMSPNDDNLVVGVRAIRLGIWTQRLFRDWCNYIVARATDAEAYPPTLAPESTGYVYFTDLASIDGCYRPEDYAERMSLEHIDDFGTEGALVILFPVECLFSVPEQDGDREPLTAGGARQWITDENVYFDTKHVLQVVPNPNNAPEPPRGSRWRSPGGSLSSWTFLNRELVDPRSCEEMLEQLDTNASSITASSSFAPEDIREIRAFLEYLGD